MVTKEKEVARSVWISRKEMPSAESVQARSALIGGIYGQGKRDGQECMSLWSAPGKGRIRVEECGWRGLCRVMGAAVGEWAALDPLNRI